MKFGVCRHEDEKALKREIKSFKTTTLSKKCSISTFLPNTCHTALSAAQ